MTTRKKSENATKDEGFNNQVATLQSINDMRSVYDQIVKQQFDAQKNFGKAFSLKGVDQEIQESVIENTRAISKLHETGIMAQVKGVISRVPVLGNLIHESYQFISDEALRNQRIDEITDGIFKTIREKQKVVVEYCESLEQIKEQSTKSHETLVNILTDMRDVDPTQLSTDDNNFIIEANKQEILLRDRILKMQATIAAAKQLSSRISNMIPTLQEDMFNQLALNQTLNSIRSMGEQLNTTIEATDRIAMDNDKAVKEALIEVTKGINTGEDYKRLLKRSEDFVAFSDTLRGIVETQQQNQHMLVNHLRDTNIAQLEQQKQRLQMLDFDAKPNKFDDEQGQVIEQAEERAKTTRKPRAKKVVGGANE